MGNVRLDGLRAMAGVIAIGLLSLAIPAASADAATYTVWSCRGPDGSAGLHAGLAGGQQQHRDRRQLRHAAATCARACSPATRSSGRFRGYTFLTPPGAQIAGYRIYLFAAHRRDSVNEDRLRGRPRRRSRA